MSFVETAVETKSEIINQVIAQPAMKEFKEAPLLPADEIPAWLNKAYIQSTLQKFYRDEDLKVNCLRITQCGGKGESYASSMYRVGTSFSDGSNKKQFKTFVVKTLPEVDIALEKLGSSNYNVQNKEMEMYDHVLPEFRRILKSINEEADIFPAVIAVDKTIDVIILEDLAEKQFVMADRLKGLHLEETFLALRKLARMHAASAIAHEKNPSLFNLFDTGFFTRKTDVFHVMFESLCDGMIAEVATWDGYEYYAKKLVSVRKNLIKNAQRAFDCDDGDFHVLTHGDLWTNNLMYKYNESGAPVDAVLLDFQFASYGSPALDLIVRIIC